MERSSELRDVMMSLYDALSSGDVGFCDRCFSTAAEVRGTMPIGAGDLPT